MMLCARVSPHQTSYLEQQLHNDEGSVEDEDEGSEEVVGAPDGEGSEEGAAANEISSDETQTTSPTPEGIRRRARATRRRTRATPRRTPTPAPTPARPPA